MTKWNGSLKGIIMVENGGFVLALIIMKNRVIEWFEK